MTKQTKILVLVGSVVSALLVVAIVVGAILIGTLNAQQSEAEYRACMADRGVSEMNSVEDIADAAEACSR